MVNKISKNLIFFILILIFSLIFVNFSLAAESESSNPRLNFSNTSPVSTGSNLSGNDSSGSINDDSNPSFSTNPLNNNLGSSSSAKNIKIKKPTIVSIETTNITENSATLEGSVNPNGSDTEVHFETSTGVILKARQIGNGNNAVALNPYILKNLNSNTKYSFRIVATNSIGSVTSNWIYFITQNYNNNSQIVVSAQASTITSVSALLNGSVNPNGNKTRAWFEIDTIKTTTTQDLGHGTTVVNLSSYNLTGLDPNTQYKFRVVTKTYNSSESSLSINDTNNTGSHFSTYTPSSNLGYVYGNWIYFTTSKENNSGSSSSGSSSGSYLPKKPVVNNNPVVYQPSYVNTNSNTNYSKNSNSSTITKTTSNDENNSETMATDDLVEEYPWYRGLTASSIFGNGNFLPSSFLDWIILFAIILIILIIIRAIVRTYHKPREISANHIENLPM